MFLWFDFFPLGKLRTSSRVGHTGLRLFSVVGPCAWVVYLACPSNGCLVVLCVLLVRRVQSVA